MAEAVYHGQDKEAAIARAKEIDGYVIESKPPAGTVAEEQRGYWSDDSGFVRNWERQVWPEEK